LSGRNRVLWDVATRLSPQRRSSIALNAIRLVCPEEPIPAAIAPFELSRFHDLLDRPDHNVFVTRYGDSDMAIVPLKPDADLSSPTVSLPASANIRLFATLAREAVFRHLLSIPGNYRVVNRRPPKPAKPEPKRII
jgi:hypothetical protein